MRVPRLTRGHTSTDGEVEPDCEVANGARSQRSYGSTDVTDAAVTAEGSVRVRSTTSDVEEPRTTNVVSERRPDEKVTLLRTKAVLSKPP